jgi:hypothetical protein
MRSPVRATRRGNGGVRVTQGRNFIILSADEATHLAADIRQLTDSTHGAETATQSDDRRI